MTPNPTQLNITVPLDLETAKERLLSLEKESWLFQHSTKVHQRYFVEEQAQFEVIKAGYRKASLVIEVEMIQRGIDQTQILAKRIITTENYIHYFITVLFSIGFFIVVWASMPIHPLILLLGILFMNFTFVFFDWNNQYALLQQIDKVLSYSSKNKRQNSYPPTN